MNNDKGKGMTKKTKGMTTREKVDFYVAAARVVERFVNSPDDSRLAESELTFFDNPPQSHAEALDWFEAEHANLLAAQWVAATHEWHQDVWDLAGSLTAYHHRRGGLRSLLAVWQLALTSAGSLSHVNEATAHKLLGDTYAAVGWHDEALVHLNQALRFAEAEGDIEGRASAHFILAIAYERNEDEESAFEHASLALDFYREAGNEVWEAAAQNMVGWHLAQREDYDEAREHCQASLALHRAHHDPAGSARALSSLGYIYRHTDDAFQAIAHYREALTLFRDLGHTFGVAGTLDELGHAYVAAERYDEARTAWQEALTLFEEQGRHRAAADVQKQLEDIAEEE